MHWWQSPFSSSSSSSSSSSKRHSENSGSHKIWLLRGRAFRSQPRRNCSYKKQRHRSHDDGEDRPRLWRSTSSQDQLSPGCSTVAPQPLPLPELAVLLRRDAGTMQNSTMCRANVPLPSPIEPPSGGREEKERADGLTGDVNGDDVALNSGFKSVFGSRVPRRIKEHDGTRLSSKTPEELYGAKRFQQNVIHVAGSAPTSPFSSPSRSPQRSSIDIFTSHCMSPQVFQVWSAPEIHPSDMNLGHHMSPEKIAFSVDSSPLHSPRGSPCRSIRSPSGLTSPLYKKLSLETPRARRDSCAQTSVHPLPLPPGVTSPTQPNSVPQVVAIPDSMSIKSQWQKGKLIGRGTFGSVYVGSNRENGSLCAMKEVELSPDDPRTAECTKQLEQEIKVLSRLKHPNIVQYYGSEIIGDRFYIYLEYVHPGSLNKYIREHCGAITESVVRSFTRHILCGLAYLHSTKTIHRDIKGANLLVDAYGVVKLADFGMAKHLTGPASYLSLKGSPYWMAPELLQSVMQKDASSDLALAVDIWSLGCTIIEMLNGKPPWSEYEGAAAMFKVLRETPPIPQTLSPEGKDFLRCCLRRNPAERPSASMLLEHRFLRNSHQIDVPACTQALDGLKLKDKARSRSERPSHNLEQLLVSAEAQTRRGKPSNTQTSQRSHPKTSDAAVVARFSPRSTLEALPSLSPPRSDQSRHSRSPSLNPPSPIREDAKRNQYLQ